MVVDRIQGSGRGVSLPFCIKPRGQLAGRESLDRVLRDDDLLKKPTDGKRNSTILQKKRRSMTASSRVGFLGVPGLRGLLTDPDDGGPYKRLVPDSESRRTTRHTFDALHPSLSPA